jgi:hypothetical protein
VPPAGPRFCRPPGPPLPYLSLDRPVLRYLSGVVWRCVSSVAYDSPVLPALVEHRTRRAAVASAPRAGVPKSHRPPTAARLSCTRTQCADALNTASVPPRDDLNLPASNSRTPGLPWPRPRRTVESGPVPFASDWPRAFAESSQLVRSCCCGAEMKPPGHLQGVGELGDACEHAHRPQSSPQRRAALVGLLRREVTIYVSARPCILGVF